MAIATSTSINVKPQAASRQLASGLWLLVPGFWFLADKVDFQLHLPCQLFEHSKAVGWACSEVKSAIRNPQSAMIEFFFCFLFSDICFLTSDI
jgi:hypothetical protein